MSDSDDTDLLLLIPPDFFVIHSDSEDSTPNSRRTSKDQARFKELISQVNELEERVNLIESKDNIDFESFSEANRINTYVDYTSSINTFNYHKVHDREVDLTFYSSPSAKFTVGNGNDSTTGQLSEPYIVNASVNKALPYPHHTFSTVTEPIYGGSVNDLHDLSSSLSKQVISLETYDRCPESSNNKRIMDYTLGQSALKYRSAEELQLPCSVLTSPQPRDLSFLDEIDKFLENRNVQFTKPLLANNSSEIEHVTNVSVNVPRSTIANETMGSRSELQLKLATTNEGLCAETSRATPHVDMLSNAENPHLEGKFKYLLSKANFNPTSYLVDPDRPYEMEDHHHGNHRSEKDKNIRRKSGEIGHSSYVQSQETQTFNQNPLHNPSFPKLNVSSNTYTRPKQSLFLTNSFWDNESKGKKLSYDESENHVRVDLNRNTEKHLSEKQSDFIQSENVTLRSPSKNSNTIKYENECHRLHSEIFNENTVGYLSNKKMNSLMYHSKMPGSKNALPLESHGPRTKDEISLNTGKQSCVSSVFRTNLEETKEGMSNYQNFMFASEANSSVCNPHLKSESNVESLGKQEYHTLQMDPDQCVTELLVNKDSNHPLKGCDAIHPEISTANLHKNIGLASGSDIHQKEERRQVSQKSVEGVNRAAKPTFLDDGYYSSAGGGSSAANLLSLSELWGGEVKELQPREVMPVDLKLEEERCRRKHCENVIHHLQCSVLEQQQKLAVAMRVDQSKDQTIQELQIAWRRLASHWQEIEDQRHKMSVMYSEERDTHQHHMAEIVQKVKWCEAELSKALDLAQGYKEKSEMIECKMLAQVNSHAEEKRTLEITLQEGQKCLVEAREELTTIQNELSGLKEKLEAAEKCACGEKESAVKAHEEVKALKTLLENREIDFSVVKEENSSLQLRLKEERSRNDILDQQCRNFNAALDESRKKEKSLEEELAEKIITLDKTKTDLRDYYQQQVELVVQEKLIEFQTQLDAAELSLHKEMEQREKLAFESASKQVKHITEKNLLEVKLLEEKHREELHLCKLQLTQATQHIHKLQTQLQSYSNRKVEIVEKLHTVMETQWQEALRIISGSSPVVHSFEHRGVLEKETFCHIPDRDGKSSNININSVPPLPMQHSSGSSSMTDEIPFNKEDQLTYRANEEAGSSERVLVNTESADAVKKYIEMLLNCPGNPLEQESLSENSNILETSIHEGRALPKWEKVMENHRILQSSGKTTFPCCSADDSKSTQVYSKDKSSKPPWK